MSKLYISFFCVYFIIAGLAVTCIADEYGPKAKCPSCERYQPVSSMVAVTSRSDGLGKKVCRTCINQSGRCYACKIPAVASHKVLEDGRMFCLQDFNEGTFDSREADRIAYETTRELTPLFYRFGMKFPESNVRVSIVDARKLHDMGGQYYSPNNCTLQGLTRTVTRTFNGSVQFNHDIYLISGLPRKRLIAVYAHEIGHAWLAENISGERLRGMSRDTIEGFCELIAYQLMESRYEEFEKVVIKENLYTKGQQNMLIETDSWYGFQKILTWFKAGTTGHLTNPDAVRTTVKENTSARRRPTTLREVQTTQAPIVSLPNSVVLKGISGSPKRRLALINNANLREGEGASLQLAHTNVQVQCIQILESSVTLKINGAEKELFLNVSPR